MSDAARERLARARAEVDTALSALAQGGLGQSQQDAVQDLSSYDNHPADAATDTFEREKDIGYAGALRARRKAIDRAEDRLAQGTYGRCEGCGGPIGDERLSALPWTTLCLACEREREARDAARRTPRAWEEGTIAMPFGQNAERGQEPVQWDGEDTWQAVARYGTSSRIGEEPDADDERAGVVEAVDALPDPDADTARRALGRVGSASERRSGP